MNDETVTAGMIGASDEAAQARQPSSVEAASNGPSLASDDHQQDAAAGKQSELVEETEDFLPNDLPTSGIHRNDIREEYDVLLRRGGWAIRTPADYRFLKIVLLHLGNYLSLWKDTEKDALVKRIVRRVRQEGIRLLLLQSDGTWKDAGYRVVKRKVIRWLHGGLQPRTQYTI